MSRICIVPRVEGLAGVASFRLKFENGLRARGLDVTYDLSAASDAVLVLAGTRNLLPLWKARSRGQRIVQRLDGVNWVHRVRWAGLKYTARAAYGNANLAFIRARLADQVIYQSQFIKGWWETWYGVARPPAAVILNGVDLKQYSPNGMHERPTDHYRLLVVEGSLKGGLDSGLFHAVELANRLAQKFKNWSLSVAWMRGRKANWDIKKHSRFSLWMLCRVRRFRSLNVRRICSFQRKSIHPVQIQ
jgi:glycosyltransferase involved in cell wall biosynthesis